MAASTTSARNSSSVRAASSVENSTSSNCSRAIFTPSTARRTISSLAILSLKSRWMGLVARKTWQRRRGASCSAFQEASMSPRVQRDRLQMMGPSIWRGDALDGLEVARRGGGEAGLDDVHAQLLEGPRHPELLPEVHGEAGALLAVAKGRVEHDDAIGGTAGTAAGVFVLTRHGGSRAPVRGRRSDSRHRDRPLRPFGGRGRGRGFSLAGSPLPPGEEVAALCVRKTRDEQYTESPDRVNERSGRPRAARQYGGAPSLRSSSTNASRGMVLRSSPPRRRGRDPLRLDLLLADHQR